MEKQLQRKLIVGQTLVWASAMIGNAIVLVILDNWDGRFTFATVSMFSLQFIIFSYIIAHAHLQSILKRVNAGSSDGEQGSDSQ
ncbi:MAG: hypothetical protein H8E66_22335 [Planctomycetes bacterium]|nr:hypothetical protein [Planctomycetota bacterium]